MGIAVINLSLLAESSPENRKKLVHMLLQSFATYGFVKVIGHGISDNTLEQLFEWTRRFFDLPKEVKESGFRPSKGPNRGYISVGREKISGITNYMKHERDPKLVEDVKESFDLGPRGDNIYPTPWPSGHDACAEFKIFMQSFFDSCLLLHHKILIVLEEALFMHSNELVSLCSAGNGEVRITHYPPLPISALKTGNKFRIAEHTDVGVLTLLFQDSVGGLEIEDQKSLAAGKDGKFIPVESKNLGEMIVNCGDTLQMWSADLLRSANHRVTYNRDLDADEREDVIIPSRYSVGFFGKANPEASIDPIAGLIGKGVKKEAVEGKGKTAQEYYNFMHEKTYS